jgi:hypothetical protein
MSEKESVLKELTEMEMDYFDSRVGRMQVSLVDCIHDGSLEYVRRSNELHKKVIEVAPRWANTYVIGEAIVKHGQVSRVLGGEVFHVSIAYLESKTI